MTLVILQASGEVLIEKIKLNSSMRSCDYAFLNVLRILVKMLFIPIAFQSSKNLRWSSTLSVVVGARKKVFKMVFHLFCCCRSKEKGFFNKVF